MVRRIVFGLMFLVACMSSGCRHAPGPTGQAQLNDDAIEYVKLVVALGEHDPDSLDYAIGPEEWVSGIHKAPPTLPQIVSRSTQLMTRLRRREQSSIDETEKQRCRFMLRQLNAIVFRVQMLTIGPQQKQKKFDDELKNFFELDGLPDYDREKLAAVRRQIAALLPGTGDLADRYQNYDRAFLIPRDKLKTVMQKAIVGCRQQTAEQMRLPVGESIQVEYVTHEPWSGFSRYKGKYTSLVQFNTDFPLTIDRALELACHESYPGHHVFNSRQEEVLTHQSRWPELTVQPTFSPQSFLSESAANYAATMAFAPERRLAFEREVLFPAAGLNPALAQKYLTVERLVEQLHVAEPTILRNYINETLEYLLASNALRQEALMADPDASLEYANEFRSYVVTYTYGVDLVRKYVEGDKADVPLAERWQRYLTLMEDPAIRLQK